MEKVSIVTMTYNRAKVLDKTLSAMLELDYPDDYEIIVVNDGSTDNTKHVLKKFKKKNKSNPSGTKRPLCGQECGNQGCKIPYHR